MSSHLFEITYSVALSFLKTISCYHIYRVYGQLVGSKCQGHRENPDCKPHRGFIGVCTLQLMMDK